VKPEHSSTEGLLIDLGRMNAIRLWGSAANVGPGVRIAAMASLLAGRGMTVPCGWCPTVGVAGAVLGGGYGALGRLHGLGCDHLLAAEVVLADGRIVVASPAREPDLFWALRGAGGGNFGVVTSLLLRTRPAVRTTTFRCRWAYRHAAEAIAAWQRWAPDAPGEVNAELALLASGDPAEPPLVALFGLVAGDRGTTLGLLAEFAALVGAAAESVDAVERPSHDAAGQLSYLGVPASECLPTGRAPGEPPGLRVSRSGFFDQPLPAAAIDRLVEHFAGDRPPGQFRDLELIPWRGAYSAVATQDTAFFHRGARFMLKHAVQLEGRASGWQRRAASTWLTGSTATVRGCGNGHVYPNYPDPDLADWPTAYYGTNLPRLRRVKAAYDPADTFRFEQSIPPSR